MSLLGRGRRGRRLGLVVAGTLFAFQALAIVGATSASAAPTCSFSGGVWTILLPDNADEVWVTADSNGFIDPQVTPATACTGGAASLLSNTTAINITGGAGNQWIGIDLSDENSDPIDWGTINWNIQAGAGTEDVLDIDGADLSEAVDIALGASGVDLNNDGDLDVTVSGQDVTEVEAGSGDDTVSAAGSTATGAAYAGDIAAVATTDFGTYGGIFGYAGDDTLAGGAGNDEVFGGDDDDTISGGAGDDTLDGEAGTGDTVDFSGSAAAVTVTLPSTANGEGLDSLAGFENVIGTAQADTITGDGLANLITPGAGDDKVNGGAGEDMVDFSDSAAGVTVDLDAGTATGDGSDTLSNVEDVQESDLADVIAGDTNDNMLFGGAGNDSLSGGPGGGDGADVLNGEGGLDWVDYSLETDSVTVDLTTADTAPACDVAGDFDDGVGGEDCVANVENAQLGAGDDTFVGNGFGNIVGPGGGQNILTGGGGGDTLDYSVGYDAGVEINLAGGSASQDSIDSFENVKGTAFADSITGSDGSNLIKSGKGNDNVRAGAGDDTIKAGAGNDRVRAGSGDDDLFGAKGNDYLNGGNGDDFCKSGPGKDTVKKCESGK